MPRTVRAPLPRLETILGSVFDTIIATMFKDAQRVTARPGNDPRKPRRGTHDRTRIPFTRKAA